MKRPDDTSGMALVGLVGLLLVVGYLVYLRRQWRSVKPGSTGP
jgi:LPXTG-motif cell wall-anchored protein